MLLYVSEGEHFKIFLVLILLNVDHMKCSIKHTYDFLNKISKKVSSSNLDLA